MKLTLPVCGVLWCEDHVGMSIQLLGESDMLVIKCKEHKQAWGTNGVYSTFGLIEFDTADLKIEESNILKYKHACINYENIKFTRKTVEELSDWFYRHYEKLCPNQSHEEQIAKKVQWTKNGLGRICPTCGHVSYYCTSFKDRHGPKQPDNYCCKCGQKFIVE